MGIEPSRTHRFLLMLLLAGGGMLAFGLAAVYRSLRDAELRAEVAAREATEARARELRDVILRVSPERLDGFEVEHGHVLARGVRFPDPDPDDPFAELPEPVRALISALEREPARSDEPALEIANGLPPNQSMWLLTWSAWRAVRHATRDVALERLTSLNNALMASSAEPYRQTIMSAALLQAELGGDEEPVIDVLAPLLPHAHRVQLSHALSDRGYSASGLAEPRDSDIRRRVFEAARSEQRRLAATVAPTAFVMGDAVIVYRPTDATSGVGRVFPRADLVNHPLARGMTIGSLPGAIEVFPGCALVPVDPPADSNLGLVIVLAAFGLLFVASFFATRRALIRETNALTARADFLTSVTHELKTPLSSIRLLSERLKEGRVTGANRRQEYFDLLAGESARLSVLIENVLDLGRMERRERGYDMQLHDLNELVRDAVELFRPLAEGDGIRLDLSICGTRAPGQADASAFVQALINVLENARKYARRSPAIDIETRVIGGNWQIDVRDYGPGVPEAERESIFDRFVRGSAQADGSIAGVGLGLHLAWTIVSAHGGALRYLDPDEGPGSRFRFTLPLEEPDS